MIGFKNVDGNYILLCIEIVPRLAEQFIVRLRSEKHEDINIGLC
jgi:hypothetical protein